MPQDIAPQLLQRRWMHSREEDTATEMVFRPASYHFPPARGRTGFALGPDKIDGDFGAATRAAVIAFQESKDLPADGIAGPNTLAALGLNFPESQPAVASDTGLTSTLFVDYYQFDNGRIPDLTAVSADGRYAGTIVKATEGLYYNGGNWFSQQWPSIHDQNGYRDTWLRGC